MNYTRKLGKNRLILLTTIALTVVVFGVGCANVSMVHCEKDKVTGRWVEDPSSETKMGAYGGEIRWVVVKLPGKSPYTVESSFEPEDIIETIMDIFEETKAIVEDALKP